MALLHLDLVHISHVLSTDDSLWTGHLCALLCRTLFDLRRIEDMDHQARNDSDMFCLCFVVVGFK